MLNKDKERIIKWLEEGYSCSQVILRFFLDRTGMALAMALRVSQPFERGHYLGGTCGALTGGLMVLGLIFGGQDEASKLRLEKSSNRLLESFKARMKTTECRELLGMNVNYENNLELAYKDGRIAETCPSAIFSVIDILEEIL